MYSGNSLRLRRDGPLVCALLRIRWNMTFLKLSLTIVAILVLFIQQGCSIRYYFDTQERKPDEFIFKGYILEHEISTAVGVNTSSDSIEYGPTVKVKYVNKVRDTIALDSMGVVFIDSLCYQLVPSNGNICATGRKDINFESPEMDGGIVTTATGPYWAWDAIYILSSTKLIDVSFLAILRHPRTGEEMARQRFIARLKRFTNHRFVITE